MKITLNFEDIKKLIEESYEGINSVALKDDKDIDILLDVDGDTFKRIKEVRGSTPSTIASGVDYEKLLEEKRAQMKAEITGEPIPGVVKTLEEKNEEARQKGLMTTGRGAERTIHRVF